MARNRIFMTLAVMAVGLLALSTVLTPEARAGRIYGQVHLVDFSAAPDHTVTVYVQEENWPGPQYQRVSPPYLYDFDDLDMGTYEVWAVYEDELKICASPKYRVELDQDEQHWQDIYIDGSQCENKP